MSDDSASARSTATAPPATSGGCCLEPVASQIGHEVVNALRVRAIGDRNGGTPGYSDRELKLILGTARDDVARLRNRLRAADDLLRRFGEDREQLTAAEQQEALRLAAMAEHGIAAPDEHGNNTFQHRQGLTEPLFVTRRDVPPLLILLVAITSRNIETIKELTAEHKVLEGRTVEVRLTKRRRGPGTGSRPPPGRSARAAVSWTIPAGSTCYCTT